MKKRFNTAGLCIPSMHYMVNIDDKLEKIKVLIDRKDYEPKLQLYHDEKIIEEKSSLFDE